MGERATRGGAAVWREPVRGGYAHPGMLSLPGLERLTRFRRLHAPSPPLFHLTGAQPATFGEGVADAEMPASRWLLNSAGVIGGGTLSILADIAFGCAVETLVPAGVPFTTAELSLTFLRPARPDGAITGKGKAIHLGRQVGLSEASLLDESGRLIAHGTSRLAMLPPVPDLPDLPERWPERPQPDHPTPDPYLRPAPESVLGQEVWDELGGLEVLKRQMRGQLPPPPIHALTGLKTTEAAEGRATLAMPATEWLANPAGRLQGGTIAMLADAAMMAAAVTKAGPGTAVAGVDLKVNFLRPALPDGEDLRARAEVVHHGRTLAICRSRVEGGEGKPVALATGSAMFLPGRAASLEGDVELSGDEGDAAG